MNDSRAPVFVRSRCADGKFYRMPETDGAVQGIGHGANFPMSPTFDSCRKGQPLSIWLCRCFPDLRAYSSSDAFMLFASAIS